MSVGIKQFVFDFGGVLIEWNPKKIAESYASEKTVQEAMLKEIFLMEWMAQFFLEKKE